MRIGHGVGLVFAVACLIGLYLAWPHVRGWLGGTWFADLRLLVFAVFAALALSGLHALETWVGDRFAQAKMDTSDR